MAPVFFYTDFVNVYPDGTIGSGCFRIRRPRRTGLNRTTTITSGCCTATGIQDRHGTAVGEGGRQKPPCSTKTLMRRCCVRLERNPFPRADLRTDYLLSY